MNHTAHLLGGYAWGRYFTTHKANETIDIDAPDIKIYNATITRIDLPFDDMIEHKLDILMKKCNLPLQEIKEKYCSQPQSQLALGGIASTSTADASNLTGGTSRKRNYNTSPEEEVAEKSAACIIL